ncbi:A disintegrin and metalloproteinase with thrombospondin motifs 20-like [Dendronephthya gigantea]|uniref:A disintegrin and metalloproteinase with thrombospondin motifs 20-like n=1 Tax=Dendronephthya gigantea TaxID=151771 RepID=UPI001069FBF2|nr:A disintegrin and metalloproteinase with thrombospondin motifs 20-like [Dendronephthya gigantea]XP_028417349.1 A disintegrin and metalloproteinase with thrombospondin motifs 20-like [Dendronephthya gigantea]
MESTPLEYISLTEHENNYAGSHKKNKMREEKTYFKKIRIVLPEKSVKGDDYFFTTTNYPGSAKTPYASASDCYSYSCSVDNRKGSFKVDLTGTSFHLPNAIAYGFNSYPSCVKKVYAASMSSDNLRWSGKCGGYCGECSPKSFSLLLNGC